jgi:uncharacterized membrane protein YdjX (TVP38/TMEM64 family)
MQSHIIATFVGLVLGSVLVAWLGTDAGGTTFVVVLSTSAANAVAAVIALLKPKHDRAARRTAGQLRQQHAQDEGER